VCTPYPQSYQDGAAVSELVIRCPRSVAPSCYPQSYHDGHISYITPYPQSYHDGHRVRVALEPLVEADQLLVHEVVEPEESEPMPHGSHENIECVAACGKPTSLVQQRKGQDGVRWRNAWAVVGEVGDVWVVSGVVGLRGVVRLT
jgi:hypothetical protein